MLPRIPPCGLFSSKASSAFRSLERATAVAIASKFGTLPSGMSDAERSLLVILCARAIASFGFGLSIFFIWLRWFVPVVPPIIPPIIPALDHGRRRPPPSCLPGTPTSCRTDSQPVVNLDSPVTPLKRYRGHARRVSFADSLHSEIGKTTDQDVTRADITLLISPLPGELDTSTSASVPSTPTQSGSPLSTPALTPTSTLEDSTDHELEPPPPPRRSNSTSHLIPKIKSPFHTKNKRSSLPSSLLEGSTELPITTPIITTAVTTTTKPKKKKSRPFTPPWRHSCMKSTVANGTEVHTSDAKTVTSRISFSSRFSRPSSSGSRSPSPSPNHTHHRSLASVLFTRKASQRSTHAPIPRTLPYEAPYFARPPVPFDKTHCRARSARSSLDHAPSTAPSRTGTGRRTSHDTTHGVDMDGLIASGPG